MAAQSGMSEYTLRYYEKIGLIQPIPRDGSSGHRRYSAATAQMVEALACLRASGLSLDEMRLYLRLRERGDEAAAEQKALFLAHAEEVADEIRHLTIRQRYLSGKVAYWDARMNGDMELAEQIAAQNLKVNHFNTILSTHTAPTPTTIATSTFFVRSATSADASAASVSARLLASTVGAIIATSTAPGICRSHASMRGEGVTRPISQKPPARVAYVTSAIPRIVISASVSLCTGYRSNHTTCNTPQQDVPLARQPVRRRYCHGRCHRPR